MKKTVYEDIIPEVSELPEQTISPSALQPGSEECVDVLGVDICYELLPPSTIKLKARIFGISIARGTLTQEDNYIEGRVNAGLAKASLRVTADFEEKKLIASAKVCHKTVDWRGVHWSCDDSEEEIASW